MTYDKNFSPILGIASRLVSSTNMNEESECVEESVIIHVSLQHRARKWSNRSDSDQRASRNDTYHVSCELTRECQ
uniref:Uncharacterized protein n=1 Tax=Onchocerca volvulus TaxID=6282 RepID=A0A8R1TSB3_ONCVO